MLYMLWDLKLKVGHSSRSLDEVVRMAKSDLTIRTALLEGRYVWGDQSLYDEVVRRFADEVVKGTEKQFVADKLEERNARHKRMGDSRYVVEPNIKDGKGGLRDLHVISWVSRAANLGNSWAEMAKQGPDGKPSLEHFISLQPLWTKGDALQIETIRKDAKHYDFNVTRCRYAEMYRAMGLAELGAILSCNRDGAFCILLADNMTVQFVDYFSWGHIRHSTYPYNSSMVWW